VLVWQDRLMHASTRTLTLAVIATIAYNVVLTLLAIWQNWPSQFGIVGTDPVKEWSVSGTAISAPVLPLLVLFVALVLLAGKRGRFRIVGDLLVLVTATLFVIGGIGEIAGAPTEDTPRSVLLWGGIQAILIAAVLIVLSVRDIRRGSDVVGVSSGKRRGDEPAVHRSTPR
jgi:hypothetical protein